MATHAQLRWITTATGLVLAGAIAWVAKLDVIIVTGE